MADVFAPKYGQLMAVAHFSNASIKPIGALLHQLNPLEKAPILQMFVKNL
ncbi:MAG: hypothetical protein LUO94_01120 [Methylococcaceae bacterium]|jgi:hypothetical protein|nr:hypothetical protein [Methylococcaceae bacterium]MDD1630975.1 hypothetical protein [Methylococcaceae bacterium]MDD1644563.1 hypothetical protein [Methylococcaceae bacterium]